MLLFSISVAVGIIRSQALLCREFANEILTLRDQKPGEKEGESFQCSFLSFSPRSTKALSLPKASHFPPASRQIPIRSRVKARENGNTLFQFRLFDHKRPPRRTELSLKLPVGPITALGNSARAPPDKSYQEIHSIIARRNPSPLGNPSPGTARQNETPPRQPFASLA